MYKESLEKARDACIKIIQGENIDLVDMCELIINIDHFLDPEDYKENIDILQKRKIIKKEERKYGRN